MKRLLIALAALFSLNMLVFAPKPAAALFEDFKEEACKGVSLTDKDDPATEVDETDCGKDSAKPVNSLLKNVINIISLIVGIVALIAIILGGIRFATSTGDPQKVSSARDTIVYAVIGLIVALLAQVLVRFVLNKASQEPPKTEETSETAA